MQDRINFNQPPQQIEQHFANLNSGLGNPGVQDGGVLHEAADQLLLGPDRLQTKLSERQQLIEQYKKLRKDNQRSSNARQRKILQILEGTRPSPFDDPSKKLEKKILRESLSLLMQQQMQNQQMAKNQDWGEINKLERLNLDQNSKGWPRLPAIKQDSSEIEVERFQKRLDDIKKISSNTLRPPRHVGGKPPLSRKASGDLLQLPESDRGHTDRLMAKSQQIIQSANKNIETYQEKFRQAKKPIVPLDIPRPPMLNRSRSGQALPGVNGGVSAIPPPIDGLRRHGSLESLAHAPPIPGALSQREAAQNLDLQAQTKGASAGKKREATTLKQQYMQKFNFKDEQPEPQVASLDNRLLELLNKKIESEKIEKLERLLNNHGTAAASAQGQAIPQNQVQHQVVYPQLANTAFVQPMLPPTIFTSPYAYNQPFMYPQQQPYGAQDLAYFQPMPYQQPTLQPGAGDLLQPASYYQGEPVITQDYLDGQAGYGQQHLLAPTLPNDAMMGPAFPDDAAAFATAGAVANQHTLYDQGEPPLSNEEMQFHLQQVPLEERQQQNAEPDFNFNAPIVEPAIVNIELQGEKPEAKKLPAEVRAAEPGAGEAAAAEGLEQNFQMTFVPLSSEVATMQMDIPGDASGRVFQENQAQVIGNLSLENERLKQRYGREVKEVLGQVEEAVGIGAQDGQSKEELERIRNIREYWNNMNIDVHGFDSKSFEMQQMIQNAKEGADILNNNADPARLSSRTVIEQPDKIIQKENEIQVQPSKVGFLSVPANENHKQLPTPALDEGLVREPGVSGSAVAEENATRRSDATQQEDLSKGIHREDSQAQGPIQEPVVLLQHQEIPDVPKTAQSEIKENPAAPEAQEGVVPQHQEQAPPQAQPLPPQAPPGDLAVEQLPEAQIQKETPQVEQLHEADAAAQVPHLDQNLQQAVTQLDAHLAQASPALQLQPVLLDPLQEQEAQDSPSLVTKIQQEVAEMEVIVDQLIQPEAEQIQMQKEGFQNQVHELEAKDPALGLPEWQNQAGADAAAAWDCQPPVEKEPEVRAQSVLQVDQLGNTNVEQELKPTEDVVQEALKIAGVVQNPFLEEQMLPAWEVAPAYPEELEPRPAGLGAQLFGLVQGRPSESLVETGQTQQTAPAATQPERQELIRPQPIESNENREPPVAQDHLQPFSPLQLQQQEQPAAQLDPTDSVNILDTLKNIEQVLKAEEDQVINMYSQLNPAEGQNGATNADAEKLSTIREQHSIEMMTTHRGGGALATAEPTTAGPATNASPLDASSPKPISQFAMQQDQILQEIEDAVNDIETKLSSRKEAKVDTVDPEAVPQAVQEQTTAAGTAKNQGFAPQDVPVQAAPVEEKQPVRPEAAEPHAQQLPEPGSQGTEVLYVMKATTEEVQPANQIQILETNTDPGNAQQNLGSLTPLNQTERNLKLNAEGKGTEGKEIENEIQYLADQWSQKSTNIVAVEIDKASNIDRMYTEKSHLRVFDPDNKQTSAEPAPKQENDPPQLEPADPNQQPPADHGDLRKAKPTVVPKLDTNDLNQPRPDQVKPPLQRSSTMKGRTSEPQRSGGQQSMQSRNSITSMQSPLDPALNKGLMQQTDARQEQRQKIRRQLSRRSKADFGPLLE